VRAGRELAALASEVGTTSAALAMAFVLTNSLVATVLFGATSPEQIRENVAAADVVAALTESQLERLRAIGV
jgi:aryl-alcohol dehydrogenase-like predicted oxidoreductase